MLGYPEGCRPAGRHPMLFFNLILNFGQDGAPDERRVVRRLSISPRFPLKTVLNLVGRDDHGEPLVSADGTGWDWSGRLVNISTTGARLQVPPGACARSGDTCRLKLDLEGHLLELPGRIVHVKERRDSLDYGLALDALAAGPREAYDQFLELIALGATLKPVRPLQAIDDHYLVEQYAGDPGAQLDVWRHSAGGDVAAFEFRLRDHRVRGHAGRNELEFLPATAEAAVPPEQSAEIHRLFHWVVPNLPTTVPVDVREFLRQYAA